MTLGYTQKFYKVTHGNTCKLTASFRDLDRERSKLEQQEKKVIADIKKMAKEGQMVSLANTAEPLFNKHWPLDSQLQC